MPDPLVSCPSCGLEVPKGKYCKLCGEPLLKGEEESIPDLADEHDEEVNVSEEIQDIITVFRRAKGVFNMIQSSCKIHAILINNPVYIMYLFYPVSSESPAIQSY